MNDPQHIDRAVQHTLNVQRSYQAALSRYHTRSRLARISWGTWIIVLGTTLLWCITATQAAQAVGAHSLTAIITQISHNAINTQANSDNSLTTVLLRYGAKENSLLEQGQYWRFILPIFLHVNLLHVGLNMLNLLALGLFIERLVGHIRLVLIYLITGIISTITSFWFAPAVISVGASGAIFGLVGAYCIFILVHRRAFPYGGLFTLLWLLLVIGLNLGIGLVLPNVDNYAHLGGLISGFWLGWCFMPLYRADKEQKLNDIHQLRHRWPLALLTILGTLLFAVLALHLGN
ncbi:rhomboid family intramembrane serine protease [Dictyobacter arantiisoli]|uniref:Peptidase S54 rhomboid domain-containing protein n=1 Tax=Dictyobacter arantiisoli TaxID=2014874 RepID=A0A5A5TJF5_9CHLR|nr:rhomboid family intramembrane serine protease [Dictyobacter arantiisoli]GCF11153.1 hypothetical protein KDI_47170 [Dictyobacter arantiisoli]